MEMLFALFQDGDMLCTDMGVALIFVEYEMAEEWLANKGLKAGEHKITIEPVEVSVLLDDKTLN